jgi:hypothetical protein
MTKRDLKKLIQETISEMDSDETIVNIYKLGPNLYKKF